MLGDMDLIHMARDLGKPHGHAPAPEERTGAHGLSRLR